MQLDLTGRFLNFQLKENKSCSLVKSGKSFNPVNPGQNLNSIFNTHHQSSFVGKDSIKDMYVLSK